MDLYIKDDLTSKNSDIAEHYSIYYPSTLQHNLLFFYGLEKHFDKLWYAYFDMSDYNYIFVDMNFNNQFKLSYLIDKINSFDEKNIYLKKIPIFCHLFSYGKEINKELTLSTLFLKLPCNPILYSIQIFIDIKK